MPDRHDPLDAERAAAREAWASILRTAAPFVLAILAAALVVSQLDAPVVLL